MTIFRVDIDKYEAAIVKQAKQHPDLAKLTKQWNKVVKEFQKLLEKEGKSVVKHSRAVYTLSEKTLKQMKKDGDATNSDMAAVKDLMKSSYALTTSLKQLGLK